MTERAYKTGGTVHTTVESQAEFDLGDIDAVDVRLVGGEVTVLVRTPSPPPETTPEKAPEAPDDVPSEAPPTLGPRTAQVSIADVLGPPVEVWCEDGQLVVRHRLARSGLSLGLRRGPRATVAITVGRAVPVEIATVSAPVVLSGVGACRIKTVSGSVTLQQTSGGVELDTVSGAVEATGVEGSIAVKSVSGDATVAGGACRSLSAATVSGDFVFDLDLGGGRHRVRTVSGDVAVRTGSAGCLLDARTGSGQLHATGGDVERLPGQRRLRATIGEGRARLDVHTVSGDVLVRAAV